MVVEVVLNCRLKGSGFGVVACLGAVLSRNSTQLAKHSLNLLDPLPLGTGSGASLPYSAVSIRRANNGHLEL